MVDRLNILRRTVSFGMIVFLWAQVPLIAVACLAAGTQLLPLCAAGMTVAATSTLLWRMLGDAQSARITIAVAAIAQVSFILAACQHTALQPDIHMYYFAVLAMLAAYCDGAVILSAASVILAQHLVLNFVAPSLLFPGGTDLPRVGLHGAIVALEAVTLLWMTGRIMLPFQAAAAAEAEQMRLALREAETSRAAEALRLAESEMQQLVVTELASALERLAHGDLLQRIHTPFAKDYERLRLDFNNAVEQLLESMKTLVDCAGNIRSGANEVSYVVSDLSWRSAMQRSSWQRAQEAVTAMIATARQTADAAERASRAIAANAASRQNVTNAVANDEAAMLAGIVAELNASIAEKQRLLEEVSTAMLEAREALQEDSESIDKSDRASQKLLSEAETLVATVCEFSISEAAARAGWRSAPA
jgi:methyl-accepting chemotaxis protein